MTSPLPTLNSIEDLLLMLDSDKPEIVSELKQLIQEQFQQVNDPWLVSGVYDFHVSQAEDSPHTLDILININEPHDKFLFDKICDGLRAGGKIRLNALTLLGFVVRKQPPWLYKVTLHSLMKELIKVLKTEEDLVILMSALMDLLTLMPILPSYVSPYLNDLFEVFSRVASWRFQHIQRLPEIQQVHIQVGLYAFFHRLYGMFPCNFLSYLRSRYSESNKENQAVFTHTIRPMLNTVRMHPLLVTHSREQEKTTARWKRMELHDVIVEASRYSLLNNESSKEDQEPPNLDVNYTAVALKHRPDLTPDVHSRLWIHLGTPPPSLAGGGNNNNNTANNNAGGNSGIPESVLANLSKQSAAITNYDQSPPEAAIEATPDNTPYVTPVKDDKFRFSKPLNSIPKPLKVEGQISSSLNLKSPLLLPTPSPRVQPSPQVEHNNKNSSPFRFPEHNNPIPIPQPAMRRDSIFERPDTHSHLISKLNRIGTERTANEGGVASKDLESVAIGSTGLLGSQQAAKPQELDHGQNLLGQNIPEHNILGQNRPSPVKFTSEVPDQFPIKPEPLKEEQMQEASSSLNKNTGKIISLDNLGEAALMDYGKEEDDDEVTKITGGNEPASSLLTRHITPQICTSTSRTVSRISAESSQSGTPLLSSVTPVVPVVEQPVPVVPAVEVRHSEECKAGGLHQPSHELVNDFVRQVKGRIGFLSVCDQSTEIAAEVAAALVTPSKSDSSLQKRPTSCPPGDPIKINRSDLSLDNSLKGKEEKNKSSDSPKARILTKEKEEGAFEEERKFLPKVDSSMQTDAFKVFPYEHLFPSVLPQWFLNVKQESSSSSDHDNNQHQQLQQNEDEKEIENNDPYSILDGCIDAALKGGNLLKKVDSSSEIQTSSNTNNANNGGGKDEEVRILKNEVLLLKNLMLFERHRREVLGLRNRRLLGKTKSSRILEEQNNALKDQLIIVEAEIRTLLDQLETVRKEKHEVEESRAKGAKQRDKKIEELLSDNNQLRSELRSIREDFDKQEKELTNEKKEMANLKAAYFRAKAENNRLEEKEELRQSTEAELIHLRSEILLLGELQLKYEEKLNKPKLSDEKQEMLFVQAFEEELNGLKREMLAKGSELEVSKARIQDLDQRLAKKDQDLNEQKRVIQRVQDEYAENLECVETANASLMQTQTRMGMQIMELQDKLSHATRPIRKIGPSSTSSSIGSILGVSSPSPLGHTSSGGGERGNERGGGVAMRGGAGTAGAVGITTSFHAHSDGVDILNIGRSTLGHDRKGSTLGSDDKPFIVGSPPLSSGSSENETLRRRVLRSDPVDLERAMTMSINSDEPPRSEARNLNRNNTSEIEIGVSAREDSILDTRSSSTSSMNGNH